MEICKGNNKLGIQPAYEQDEGGKIHPLIHFVTYMYINILNLYASLPTFKLIFIDCIKVP